MTASPPPPPRPSHVSILVSLAERNLAGGAAERAAADALRAALEAVAAPREQLVRLGLA